MYDLIYYTAWKQPGLVWVGGRLVNGNKWKWQGLSTSEIDNLPWGVGQPIDNNYTNCLASWNGVDYKFDDAKCASTNYFVCETHSQPCNRMNI